MTRKEFSLVSAIIKNIGKRNYEKQLGLSKPDRQAHYYHRKYITPKDLGRYAGKLGHLRYLKDHIFGFSKEDDFVKKDKRIF